MAAPSTREGAKRRFDPLILAAGVFFLLTVALAAAPALEAGPSTRAGMMLLIGLGGVACLGLLAIRNQVEPESESEPGAETVVEALAEPAALAAADGRIQACNAAWRQLFGAAVRLPKTGPSATSLFAALADARRSGQGRGTLRANGEEHRLSAAALGPRRFLLRVEAAPSEPLALPAAAAQVLSAFASATPPPPKVLDAFAAASPFGAALLDGEDPFAAVIEIGRAHV